MEYQPNQHPGLTTSQTEHIRRVSGWNEVVEKKKSWVTVLLIRFWSPSAWMIEAIIALSWFLHRKADAGIAFVLLTLNALIGFFQERRAEHAVEILRKRLQISARALRDGRWLLLSARELVPGDVVRVRLGDLVPADIRILDGELQVDQSALTGESLDIRKIAGKSVYSGSLVHRGECTAEVTAIGTHTFYGRTIELVQSSRPKLHLDEIVGKLVRWLFAAVGVTLAVTFVVSVAQGVGFSEIFPLSLVLLMGAIPVALPVMFSVSTAVAARELGKRGVLVTRLSAAEDAATMDTLCVDKTGTITQNRMSVAALLPAPGVGEEALVRIAAQASDVSDQDPIDNAIFRAAHEKGIVPTQWRTEKFVPFSPETRRTEAIVSSDDIRHTVTKGSVAAIAAWAQSDPNASQADSNAQAQAARGLRSIAVAASENGGRIRYLGLIALHDPPRPDSAALVTSLREMGIRVRMLTGDALPVAQAIASDIGLGLISKETSDAEKLSDLLERCDGLAEVYPETKFRVIGAIQSKGRVVGMTGDGVNDAPSLKKAEVGIAVSTATDAAKAAASVVLTTEGLAGIVDLIENGRAVYQRILTWMVNKVSRTVLKSGFVVTAYFLTGKFVISAIAMLLVVLMTDFAKIALATDRVRTSRKPDTWNVGKLAFLGALLGILMIGEALILLEIGIHFFDVARSTSALHTFTFLLLLFMALFSVLSIRERKRFWSSRPGGWLLAALGTDALIGLFIGLNGLFELTSLPWQSVAFVVGGAALFSLVVNDFVKYAYLARLFGHRGTSVAKIQLVFFGGCPNVATVESILESKGLEFSRVNQEDLPPNHPLKAYSSPSVIVNGEAVYGTRMNGAASGCTLEPFDAKILDARLADRN